MLKRNINCSNANIKIVLAIAVGVYIILIFPIFIRINLKYSTNTHMLEYQIQLFSFITIFFGYVELIDEGMAIHVNNRKAILILYKDMFSIRKKFKPLKDYHIFRLKTDVSLNILDYQMQKINFVLMYNFIFNIAGMCLRKIKPYLSIQSNLRLYEKENTEMVKIKMLFVLNTLMIVISFIKIFLEKIVYAVKSRTQPNK